MDKLPGEELIKAGIEKVGEPLYNDAVSPGAKELGQAVGTILGLLNTLLTPIALVNLRVKAIYERVSEKLKKGAEEIPPERQVEPPLEIIGPVLEKVKYIEDEALQDMFVELLLASMDSVKQTAAHRAFVKIIEELSPYDAWMLKQIYEKKFRIAVKENILKAGWKLEFCAVSSYIPFVQMHTRNVASASIDNLVRLKIVDLVQMDREQFVRYANMKDEEVARFMDFLKTPYEGAMPYEYSESNWNRLAPSEIELSSFGHDFCRTCIPKLST